MIRYDMRPHRAAALAVAAALLLALSGPAPAGIYRWKDAHGGVHYTQTPPARGPYTALQGPPPPDAPPPAAAQEDGAAPAPDRAPAAAPAGTASGQGPAETPGPEACSKAQQRLAVLRRPRVMLQFPDGKVQWLTPEQRRQALDRAQQHASAVCVDQ